MRALAVVSALLLLAPLACVDERAPAKCVAFRDAYCAQQDELCANVTWGMCRDLFDELIVCDDAIGVEDDYADCLGEIGALDECPLDLPSPCKGVVLMPPADDEQEEEEADAGPTTTADAGLPPGDGGLAAP